MPDVFKVESLLVGSLQRHYAGRVPETKANKIQYLETRSGGIGGEWVAAASLSGVALTGIGFMVS